MKRILLLSILSFCFLNTEAQQLKIPVFSKVTATWCTNCGQWGWDFMEEMKDIYNNGQEAVILGVHSSGDLRNPTAEWFARNLRPIGQPVYYIDNQDQSATSGNWSNKILDLENKIKEINSEQVVQEFSFDNAYINENNEIVASLSKSPSSFNTSDEYYFGVYVFENNVEANQTPIGISSHPNVLRDVMSDNSWGDLIADNNTDIITEEYKMPLDNNWDANNIGLTAILWKKVDDNFIIENSAVIYNIGLLSSDHELINEDIVDIKSLSNQIRITIDANEGYNVSLINPLGQVLNKETFNRTIDINTSNMTSGIYTVHISHKNQFLSKQVFINK